MSQLRICDRARLACSPCGVEAAIRPYDISPDKDGRSFMPVLSDLVDAFLAQAEKEVGSFIDWRLAFLANANPEPRRSRGEYALELLTLGLLRREYGALVNATSTDDRRRLRELWRIRSGDPQRKAEADHERGRLFLDLLTRARKASAACDDFRLLRWLAATGEFVQESVRLNGWMDGSDILWSAEELARATDGLAAWFEREARKSLSRWTRGVEPFRGKVIASGEPREDLLLVTRSERLYHLNMAGAEIMNRGFRAGYASRVRKVVLVPGCMRAHNDNACQARRDGLDISCTQCDAACEVAAIDRLGRECGFGVFVIPHASTFSAWLDHWSKEQGTALLVAACPLHLVPGGYEIRGLGIDAQCILLHFSGCKRHWDPSGTPTRVDKRRLLELATRPFDPS